MHIDATCICIYIYIMYRPQSISVIDMWSLANSQQNLNLIKQGHHWSHSGINASIHAKQATSANIWTLCSSFVGSTLNCFGQILAWQSSGNSSRWGQDVSRNLSLGHLRQLSMHQNLRSVSSAKACSGCIRMHHNEMLDAMLDAISFQKNNLRRICKSLPESACSIYCCLQTSELAGDHGSKGMSERGHVC